MQEKVPVMMDKEDAALYILFCQHYDNIAFLIASKVLDTKKGSVVLDFDSAGRIQRLSPTFHISRADLPIDSVL